MLKAQRPVATHALVRPVLRRISSAGRASALQAEGRRFDPVILHHFYENHIIAGWSSSVARRAHNPKVAGSNPAPATKLLINGPVVQLVRMPACHAGGRGFESRPDRHLNKGSVAQLVEQRTENPCVGGSIPSRATICRSSSIGRATDL